MRSCRLPKPLVAQPSPWLPLATCNRDFAKTGNNSISAGNRQMAQAGGPEQKIYKRFTTSMLSDAYPVNEILRKEKL